MNMAYSLQEIIFKSTKYTNKTVQQSKEALKNNSKL